MSNLQNVMVVGLTGLTGSGKSTVSKIFSANGFTLIDADLVARFVVQKGSDCLRELQECFPENILLPNGELNRPALAQLAFGSAKKLEVMNSVMYPYITAEILRRIHQNADMGNALILLDAPTLFESRADDFCDLIISVLARADLRKERIMKRDTLTEAEAVLRMNAQLPESFFVEHSDFIIKNNGEYANLYSVSLEVIEKVKGYYREHYTDRH